MLKGLELTPNLFTQSLFELSPNCMLIFRYIAGIYNVYYTKAKFNWLLVDLMSEQIKQYWHEFCRKHNLDYETPIEAWAFGATQKMLMN